MSVVNTNIKSMVAQESLRSSGLALSTAMERLSTGKRINSAKDDAAGLAITNRMTSQVMGIAKAIQNTNDAISMTQTAEGAYGSVTDILQRMRELAVQSATGTVNSSDRSSIQLEVSQLRSQIDDIALKTNHNNIKLLDGSAQNIFVQSGSNSGDTIKMGFGSARTKDIGIGSRNALNSSNGTYSAATSFDALSASALFLNGIAVGASLALDDNSSYTAAEASAIAKAAAINKVADLSGVYAKASHTTVSGSKMTAAALTGTVTINNVVSDSFSTTADSSISRKNAVAAINAKSALHGVRAIDTGDDETGIQLVADDGRNITVAVSTVTSASTGLIAGTFVGSYELYTVDGRDINVSYADGAQSVESMSGLRAGTYKADQAAFVSYKRAMAAAATAPTSATTGLLNGNTMIVNGVAISAAMNTDDTASIDTALSSSRKASAIAIANAINRSSAQTGVTAKASQNILRADGSTPFTAAASNAQVYLNGVTFTVNSYSRNGLIDSFNAYSGRTGVVASAWGAGIQLVAADGRNITIGSSAGAAALGLSGLSIGTSNTSALSTTYYASVTLSSDNAFEVRAGSNGVDNLELLGFRQGRFGGKDNGLKINQIDVSTAAGSSQAITALDAAINTISSYQAKSGALNNRLDSVVNNLTESRQNISASRSRILDADYSTETTNLAKQQIIQQAATAMLAQANQSGQTVLSLLK